jgi:D-alanine transaminase
VQETGVEQLAHHDGDAADAVDVDHVVLAVRLHVGDVRHAAADLVEVVEREVDACLVGDGQQVERGVAVVTAEDNRWHRCDIKSISLLGNVLMRQLAADAGAAETVMFRDGYLTEASASNVLVVIGGTIVAPPKDNLILPGITYDAAIEFAADAGLPFAIRAVTRDEAMNAEEMWLSSSTKEVLAITTVDGEPFGKGVPGPVFRRMHAVFQQHKPKRR